MCTQSENRRKTMLNAKIVNNFHKLLCFDTPKLFPTSIPRNFTNGYTQKKLFNICVIFNNI